MYIGTQPYSGFRARHTYTATAGQTSFSGAGAENVTLTYSDEMYIDVYQNGVKLSPADYTATSGTTVVLAQGASVSDIVEVVKYDAFSVADTVSAKDGGGFGGNISTSGTLAVTGTSTLTGNTTVGGTLGVTGAVTANAGVVVDNITIDGTEIDLSSGSLTVDVATDITLDAGGGNVIFNDDGTAYMTFTNINGSNTSLTSNLGGDFTIDVAGDIILDADGEEILIKDGGTHIGGFKNVGTNFVIKSVPNDSDIIFQGTDGGSGIEAARFDMSAEGALCLGATSQVGAGILGISFNDSAVHGIDIIVEANASGAGFVVFRSAGGGVIGQINRNGTSNAVQYTTSSDYRLKENITYDWDATTRLKQLKPARFNWINDDTNTAIDGFIAHEVQSVVPNAVNGEKDATEIFKDADDKEQTIIKPQGIDKSDLVPLLVKSLQEALTEIDTLKTKVQALEDA